MPIVPSNIHSVLTKCIVVGLFFLLMKEARFMMVASRKGAAFNKTRLYRAFDVAFNDGNMSCDPCEDFYEYTCGQWTMTHKPPPNAIKWTNFNIVIEKTQMQLNNILKVESQFSEHPLIIKTKQLFKTCMDDDKLKKQGLLPLLRVIERVGHWPMRENLDSTVGQITWLTAHYNYARMTGAGALFNINVLPDARKPTVHRIHILQPTSLFGPYRSMPETKISTYRNSLQSMVTALVLAKGISISPSQIKILIDDVVNFRQVLLKFMVVGESSRFEADLHNPISIIELQKTNKLLATEYNVTEINWLNVLTETFKDAKKVHFDQYERIIIREYSYLLNLLFVLRDTSADIIANHIHLHFVETHLRYTTPEMRTLVADLHRSLTGTNREKRRWYNCVQENEMKHVLASMYVEKHFSASNKKEITDIFENVRDTVRRMLQESFLQKPMKKTVIKKLQNMRAIIGYRDWHMDYKLLSTYYKDIYSIRKMLQQTVGNVHLENQLSSKKRYYKAELELLHNNVSQKIDVNYAFIPESTYNYATNTIEITASLLQWPFYSPSSPASVTYSTTGYIVAHEIFHAFDHDGIEYDENALKHSCWSSDDLQIYRKRTACIRKKYAELIAREHPSENAKSIANRTIWEDFPDLLGVEAAFQTYRKQLRRHRWPSLRRTIAPLYEDQMFFRAYGNMFCGFATPKYIQDLHSSHRLRVIGPVSNLQEFSNAFKCRRGQPMNAKKKFSFWKP